ncbi:MAG: class I SAM-dependent methyltransferase [Ectothiorhodospira sp.]
MSLEDSPTQTVPGSRWPDPALRFLLWQLKRLHQGSLEVTGPDGRTHAIQGTHPGLEAAITIHRPGPLLRRLLSRGLVGLGEGYMAGDWDSPDLQTLLAMGSVNQEHVRTLVYASPWSRVADYLRHRWRDNHPTGSRRNIAYHYDLGNAFYRLWLDDGMTYSCALFATEEEPLETAQERKYARLLERLAPEPGARLLEIGCGWGGFAEYAARQGHHVTGLTLSQEQLDFARERLRAAGLAHRVDLRLQDYRDLKDTFDHVVSIEMFEAVGERFWDDWFQSIRRALRPGGRAVVQTITLDEAAFGYYRRAADFIQLYIFPGGMLPTGTTFETGAANAGLRTLERDFFGADYARTLDRWYRRVREQAPAIRALGYDEPFLRMWLFYLAYCEAGFRSRNTDLMQTVLEAPA